MRRLLIAFGIAGAIYGGAVAAGVLLYATGAIATGATHNDCADFKAQIARERAIDEQDVPQHEIQERTQACLAEHELTERHAFREEFLIWSAWPAAVSAAVFLLWPGWARVLHRQEQAEAGPEARRLDMGS